MPDKPKRKADDLKGLSQLTIDAITGITKLVEALHSAIFNTINPVGSPQKERIGGISGFVYKSTRFITQSVGRALDAILPRLRNRLGSVEGKENRESMVSALNGVLGDYLADTHNELAIAMQFRQEGKPLSAAARVRLQHAPRVLILVHGLCMNDRQWERKGHHHGRRLAAALGFVTVCLRYNTGRHISENGEELDQKLNELFPKHADASLYILAHSMGGLVSRSACLAAQKNESPWLKKLQKVVFLGTPHQGALLEKGGNWIDKTLDKTPYSKPFARLGKIRSAGITDMRYGYVQHKDWKGKDRFESDGNDRHPAPLPSGVAHYAVATVMGDLPQPIDRQLVGDGLVTVNSALGRHRNSALHLKIPHDRCWEGRGISHLGMLNSPAVYAVLLRWLGNG